MAAPAPTPGDDKPASHAPAGEGLTRESLSDPSHADPARTQLPPLAPPPAATPAGAAPARTVDATIHRSAGSPKRRPLVVRQRRRSRSRPHAAPEPQVVVHPRARRNPVVKFVYWWNGFVIRKLHTKIGTVFLGTVGAET